MRPVSASVRGGTGCDQKRPASAQRPRAAPCGPVVSAFATGLNNPRGLTDFEPDWTWYSMIAIGRALYPMDSNHGELDRVTQAGRISR
jgi:hypothetical protein